MKHALRRGNAIIKIEIISFTACLIFVLADLMFDNITWFHTNTLMYSIRNENMLDILAVLLAATVVITVTRLHQCQLKKYNEYIWMCKHCKKIYVNDKWVSFEEYIKSEHKTDTTNGVCDDCLGNMKNG
jgi:hypothetical protein